MKQSKVKLIVGLLGFCSLAMITCSAVADDILLGRPADDSITVNVIPDLSGDAYFEYGTTSGVYDSNTSVIPATAGEPFEVVIDSLSANTLYYYRMQFRETGQSWVPTAEYSFYTQRAQGSTFTFSVTTDSHIDIIIGDEDTWTQTLNNVAADNPDFVIDLGDAFAIRLLEPGDVAGAEAVYEKQRGFFDITSRSAPLFLAPGNHEQVEGWHLLDPLADSLPAISTNALKKYYLNPIPDDFYTGDTNTYSYLDDDQLREDYYAWTWGDALFVVLDPFWFSTTKPYTGDTGGGELDTTGSGDRWDWTLGLEQYNWLKQTIENSNAKFKFVFSHHMTGGHEDYSRGGANAAHFVEWGGYGEDGTTWEWDTERPGWGSQPIHQMMVANGVSAFFHGHDHMFAYEKRDGVVYQTLPSASFIPPLNQGDYTTGVGYTIWADEARETGHVRVTVSPAQATVDYIASSDGSVDYSYTIDIVNTISGYIEESDLTPVEGVTVDANNGGGSDSTDVNGYYEVSVPNDWSGTVTPTKTNYTFTPTSRSYTNVIADIPDQNYTGTESVPIVLLDDGFEGATWDANWVSPHNWLKDIGTYASGAASAHADKSNCGDFICLGLDAGDATAININFWFMKSSTDAGDFQLYYYDGIGYNLIADLDALGSDNVWLHYTDVIADSAYFIPDFQIRFNAALTGTGPLKDVWVDDVLIQKAIAAGCDAANLDGAGLVNFKDFAILANDWRLTGPGLTGDIDGNDVVNFDDLDWILDYWLNDCSQP